ncbi:hypothetical protein GQ54DRAFT_38223 [Martensiomyces pterosporus]|nr:hypothetical protein GQ54DRAFT_38223 [Martensiomyces pterosporus]
MVGSVGYLTIAVVIIVVALVSIWFKHQRQARRQQQQAEDIESAAGLAAQPTPPLDTNVPVQGGGEGPWRASLSLGLPAASMPASHQGTGKSDDLPAYSPQNTDPPPYEESEVDPRRISVPPRAHT